jgi:pimeloyl-ACP methyl ester carboxylesterase
VEVPDVSYAQSGDVSIAYQAVGEGPTDLVFLPFLANIYTLWLAPGFAEFGRRLATGRRLIVVNPRGVGLSDRPRGFTVESRMDDIQAVIDDVASKRAALVGIAEGAATCAVFAASYPDVSSSSSSSTRGADLFLLRISLTASSPSCAKIARSGVGATPSRASRAASTRNGPMTPIT